MDTSYDWRSRTKHTLTNKRQRKLVYRTMIEVLLVITLLMNPFSGIVLALESIEATGTEGSGVVEPTGEVKGDLVDFAPFGLGDTWTVTFKPGTYGVGADIVRTDVADGTLLSTLAPTISGQPGYRFNGWSGTPAYNASTPVTQDLTYTATWVADTFVGKPTRNWTTAMAAIGWSPPADAQRLLFNNVSQNGHTFLDYVYLVIDSSGNATLYFLALADNKSFTAASSYMSYAGIPGTMVNGIVYNSGTTNSPINHAIFRVDVPANLVESLIINGNPEIYIVCEGIQPHSIWGEQLKFTNISYVTQHYLYDGVDPFNQPYNLRLRAAVPGTASPGAFVTASPIDVPGYTLKTIAYTWGTTVESGTVPNDGTRLILKLYYERDPGFTWTIRGLTGDGATTIYNGQEQALSDLLPPDAPFYDIIWPVDGNNYRFIPSPSTPHGVVLANPKGTNAATYTQILELVDGYQVLYRPKLAAPDWEPDPKIYPPDHIVFLDGVWWADVADEMGAAVIIHGELTILPRPIEITTLSASKKYDGTALTRDEWSAVLRDETDPNEFDITERFGWNGLLADLDPAHKIELTVTGTQTNVGTSANTYDSLRIYYTLGGVDYDVTRNYRPVNDLGSLTVNPIVTYEANYPTGIGTELGTVPFDTNGNGPAGTNGYTAGSTVLVLGNTGGLVKLGYAFKGWATSPTAYAATYPVDSSGNIIGPAGFTISANTVLYGIWEAKDPHPVTYTIIGDAPVATTVTGYPITAQSYREGVEVTVAGNPTTTSGVKDGVLGTWAFSGWTTTSAGVTVTGGKFEMPDNAVEFVGTWSFTPNPSFEVTYTITGDTPTPHNNLPTTPQTHQSGASVSVATNPTTTATTKGTVLGTWTFSGWSSSDVTPVSGIFTMPAKNVAFTGSWTFEPNPTFEVSYEVTGDAPATVSNMPTTPQSHQQGANVVVAGVPTTTETMKGSEYGTWTFVGWNVKSGGVNISSGNFTMPGTNVVLEGTWHFTPDGYHTLTYTVTGTQPTPVSNMPTSPQTRQHNEPITVAGNPTTTSTTNAAGEIGSWSFSGWSVGNGGVTIVDNAFIMPDNDVELVGTWTFTANQYYEVTYAVTGTAPATSSAMPTTPQNHQWGTSVTVAGPLTTTSTTNAAGQLGIWLFSGWSTTDATVSDNSFTMPQSNVAFTGTWSFEPNASYEVSYEVTGDQPASYSPIPATASHQWGTTVTVASPLTTTEGVKGTELGSWTFSGWTVKSGGVTPASGSFTMPQNDVVLEGSWTFTPNASYNVTYAVTGEEPADVSGMPTTPQSHQWGATVNVAGRPTTTSTRNAAGEIGTWEFDDWTTVEVAVSSGAFTMPQRNVAFIGTWTFTANPYHNVTYTVTGTAPATADGMPTTPQSHQYEATVTVAGPLTTTTYVDAAGYRGQWAFSGWSVASGGVDISSGSFMMPDNAVALTGSWTFTPLPIYSVTYDGNGNTDGQVPVDGNGNTPDHNNTYYEGTYVPVLGRRTLVKEGYTFSGWATSKAAADAGTVEYTQGQSFMISSNVTLYAVWDINYWNVTYTYEGVVPAAAPNLDAHQRVGVAYGTTITVASEPSVTGYSFNGWTSNDVTATPTGEFTMPDKNVTFVGSWSAQELVINYIYLGADEYDDQNIPQISCDKVTTGVYDGTIAYAPNPIPYLTGYTFDGWYTLPLATNPILRGVMDGDAWIFGNSGTTLCVENGVVCADTNSLTLYAHWRATQYTIHFSPNGGVGSFPDFVGSIGDTVNLPTSAAFTRQYFTLLGFDALANAVVPTFTGSSFVLTADIIEALFTPYQTPDRTEATLYAIWSENEAYTVSYNGNGNTGGIAPVDTAGNASPGSNAYYINSLVVCLDKGTLVKAGYTFQGWALTKAAADAGTVAIKPGEDFIIVGDVEFFAVWKKNPPTPTKPAMPKTGDVSAVAQWLSVLGISASALVAYAVTSKRRKDEGLQ